MCKVSYETQLNHSFKPFLKISRCSGRAGPPTGRQLHLPVRGPVLGVLAGSPERAHQAFRHRNKVSVTMATGAICQTALSPAAAIMAKVPDYGGRAKTANRLTSAPYDSGELIRHTRGKLLAPGQNPLGKHLSAKPAGFRFWDRLCRKRESSSRNLARSINNV